MPLHRHSPFYILLLTFYLFLTACGEVENRFTNHTARFSYSPVSAVPNLYRACTSLGEFCSITYPVGTRYVIKSPSTPTAPDYIQRTALQGYQNFILGLNNGGLIIGLPSLAEMLETESRVTCYSLCCPNCYQDFNITKQLELRTGGIAQCNNCNRTYDLNNQGMVATGNKGRSLFRYYVHYAPVTQSLTVNNR